jgi:hypothetical protein
LDCRGSAEHRELTALRRVEAGEQSQERALARSVRPREPQRASTLELEIDAAQHDVLAQEEVRRVRVLDTAKTEGGLGQGGAEDSEAAPVNESRALRTFVRWSSARFRARTITART